jgi:hypothetical protein
LYTLSGKKEFRKIFPEVFFDTRDYFPVSEQIEYAFNSLMLAGQLEEYGLKKAFYYVTDGAVRYYNRILHSQLGKDFEKLLN